MNTICCGDRQMHREEPNSNNVVARWRCRCCGNQRRQRLRLPDDAIKLEKTLQDTLFETGRVHCIKIIREYVGGDVKMDIGQCRTIILYFERNKRLPSKFRDRCVRWQSHEDAVAKQVEGLRHPRRSAVITDRVVTMFRAQTEKMVDDVLNRMTVHDESIMTKEQAIAAAQAFLAKQDLGHLTIGEPIEIPHFIPIEEWVEPTPPMGTSWCRCLKGHPRMTCLNVGCNGACFKTVACEACTSDFLAMSPKELQDSGFYDPEDMKLQDAAQKMADIFFDNDNESENDNG